MRRSSVAAALATVIGCGGGLPDSPAVLTTAPQPAAPAPSSCPGYVDPAHCPPFPTSGSGTVQGTVVERSTDGTQPVAGLTVWAWVQSAIYGFSHAPVRTDSLGAFRVEGLPAGSVTLFGGSAGYDQPCAAIVAVGESAAIEIVLSTRPNPAFATTAPVLSGVVYETTLQGTRPVAGARVYFESLLDLVVATTTTDDQGRYALCRLPAPGYAQDVFVLKDGYATTDLAVTITGSMVLDIRLTR